MKKHAKPAKGRRAPLRVIYVELHSEAEVEAVEAVVAAAKRLSGLAPTVSGVTRQLFLDAHQRREKVVIGRE